MRLWRSSQPNARSFAIFIDEDHAADFEGGTV